MKKVFKDQLLENLSYTHKMHEKECELMSMGSIIMRIVSIVVICVVLGLQFAQLMDKSGSQILLVWSLGLTVFEIGLSFFQLNFNYDKLLDQHRSTAKDLVALKNRTKLLFSRKYTGAEIEELVDDINEAYRNAPQTGKLAKFFVERHENKLAKVKK